MNLISIASSLNLKAQQYALLYAKEHLPKEEYEEINTSYHLLMKKTFLFVMICCIPIMVIFLLLAMFTPISNNLEKSSMPNDATRYIMARVDYDGNFYFTNDSKKYEYALNDYGLSSNDFEFNDKVKVYVNDNLEIIEVSTKDFTNVKNMEIGIGIIFSILVPVLLIMCIFRPIAYRTFGKAWISYYKEFGK